MMMRPFRNAILTFAVVAATLGATRSALAYGHRYADDSYRNDGFFLELASGVSIPLGDDNWNDVADASFKLSLRAGYAFPVTRWFSVAPELQFDYLPVNSDDGTFQSNGVDAKINRIRALAGGRIIVPIGRYIAFYGRLALGVDYITGDFTVRASIGPISASGTGHGNTTAFSIEPGFGVQFNIHRNIAVGAYVGFPVGPDHDLNVSVNGTSVYDRHFTAGDLDLLATIQFRF